MRRPGIDFLQMGGTIVEKQQAPNIESALRGHGILKMPEACYSASGIIVNGRRIKTFLFSTDIYYEFDCSIG